MTENKMKPKRTQRHTGPNWQGKGVSGGDRPTLSQARTTSLVASPAQIKPFAGRVFYLDLPSNRTAETLESDIKELGGIVEKFFSKEIKYLVSNKREARYVHCLRQDSPVPSPDSGPSSPHPRSNPHRPGSHGDGIKSRSQGQADTFAASRGKSLVERVVKEQERVKMNKILSNALEWGVKILYIDDIKAYVQKKKKIISSRCAATTAVKTSLQVKAESAPKQGFQKYKGGRISKQFIKVEDSSRHYRPIYLTMPNMPEFSLGTVAPGSPFCVEDKDPPGNKQRGLKGGKASASEDRAHGRKKNRDKKRGGYCECCMIKYENVTMHLQSERHKAFSRSGEYFVIDELVSALHCNFIQIRAKDKRPKCSVSSVLIAPGPYGKTELRHRGHLSTAEFIKEEQHQTVDGHQESYSGHSLKIGSFPALALHREGERRSHSDRRHKSVAHKRPCRPNSLTSCSEKAEKHKAKMETAPSRGECVASSSSRVTQVDVVDQRIPDINSSASHFHNMDKQSEKICTAVTNQPEESDRKQDTPGFEAVMDGDTLPDKRTGGNLSEKEEAGSSSQSLSPVREIQRRVRVYKRKRRKVDTRVQQEEPNDNSHNPMSKLLELFQSSDDSNEEFLGFEV